MQNGGVEGSEKRWLFGAASTPSLPVESIRSALDHEAQAAYLTQGFVSDEGHAVQALTALLDAVRQNVHAVADVDFEELLENELVGYDATSIVIPITSGQDSRAILGAALRVRSLETISTYTWGSPSSHDLLGGRLAAKIAGVPHAILDIDKVDWNEADVLATLRRERAALGTAMPRIDAFWLSRACARFAPPNSVTLSGFIGGFLGGGNARHGRSINDFTKLNATGVVTSFDAPVFYDQFLKKNAQLITELLDATQFNVFDLLDYAFRQHQRISPAVFPTKGTWHAPFNTGAMVAKWSQVRSEDRVDQKLYRARLQDRYREVFAKPSTLQTFRKKVHAAWDRRDRMLRSNGDPQRNLSFGRLVQAAVERFENDGIVAGYDARLLTKRFADRDARAWREALAIASLQLHKESYETTAS